MCRDNKDSNARQETWINTKWRPMMAWMYFVVCITDFILFPLLWSILQASINGTVTQWSPITLQGAGLFHLAMGAIIGVAAWSRGQEKLNLSNPYVTTNIQEAPLRGDADNRGITNVRN